MYCTHWDTQGAWVSDAMLQQVTDEGSIKATETEGARGPRRGSHRRSAYVTSLTWEKTDNAIISTAVQRQQACLRVALRYTSMRQRDSLGAEWERCRCNRLLVQASSCHYLPRHLRSLSLILSSLCLFQTHISTHIRHPPLVSLWLSVRFRRGLPIQQTKIGIVAKTRIWNIARLVWHIEIYLIFSKTFFMSVNIKVKSFWWCLNGLIITIMATFTALNSKRITIGNKIIRNLFSGDSSK